MQETDERTVFGDFAGAELRSSGVATTFLRRAGKFFVQIVEPDGEAEEHEILYTFGVSPLQQYLVALPGGRLQALTVAWDSRPAQQGGQRWFDLQEGEAVAPGDPLHWTGPFFNWNASCAECHSTALRKGYDPATDTYATSWSEIDVSCEACHGPGSEHVEWATAVERSERPPEVEHLGLTVRLTDRGRGTWIIHPETDKGTRLAPAVETAEVETCARCHSRRTALSEGPRFGRPLGDGYRLELLDEGLYHADGQIRDEVYVHGSYLQSRMHAAGVTCSDCHDPHSLDLLFPGDRVCARCHTAARFDTGEHHFHRPGTPGAHCVDCHMPPTTYMQVDPRHDHGLRIPRPDLSLSLGTPNACNGCHDDRTNRWAAETVARWYGPGRRAEAHYGEAILAGRRRQPEGEDRLLAVLDDSEVPPIVRATAASLLGAYLTPRALRSLEAALRDAEPLVRRGALQALEEADGAIRRRLALPLLGDPVLEVRLQAVGLLASSDAGGLPARESSSLRRALAEYERAQQLGSDRAEGRLNLGWLAVWRNRPDQAELEYRRAVELAPWFAPAWVSLADLYRRLGREAEGVEVLRQGLGSALETADLHYGLGLALARAELTDAALEHLRLAAGLRPDSPRYAYVYGVALNSSGRSGEALEVLRRAHDDWPADRDLLIGLTTISRDTGDLDQARAYARRLAERDPDDLAARRLLAELAPDPSVE